MKINKTKLYPLYDQYSNDENRLTHALLHTIGSSDLIFTYFLKQIVGIKKLYISGIFEISTQKVPSSQGVVENEEKKSVPDAWIVNDNSGLGIVIEVKDKKNNLRISQLKHHAKLAQKYKNAHLLVITPDINRPDEINKLQQDKEIYANVVWSSWDMIYRLLKGLLTKNTKLNSRDKFLIDSMIEYLEGRMEVLGFQGIIFDKKIGFDIKRAKDILKLILNTCPVILVDIFS